MAKADIRGIKNLIDMSKGYFLTTVINNAIPFLLLPILTRFLTPADYGSLSLFMLYFYISNALVGVSLPTIISKHFFEKDKGYMAKMVGNAILFSAILAYCLILLICVSYSWVQSYVAIPLRWLLVIPIGSFAYIVFQIGLTVCRNEHKVFQFSKHQIGNTVFNLVITLLLVCVFAWSWMGRTTGIIISYVVSAVVAIIYMRSVGYLRFEWNKDIQKEIRTVMSALIPDALQLTLIFQAGVFFMQMFFTKEILGLYSLGFQIAFCVQLLIDAVNMSWAPFLYKQLALEDGINKVYITRLSYALMGIFIIGALGVTGAAIPILHFMTTPAYYDAFKFVPFFCLGYVFCGTHNVVMPILVKHNQQKFISFVSFSALILLIVLNVVLAKVIGSMGIAYAYCITFAYMGVLLVGRAHSVFKFPFIKALIFWK